MAKLREQEEQITARLTKKKEIKMKIEETTRKISSMKPSEIMEKSKCLEAEPEKLEQAEGEELEKVLLASAVRKMGSK